MCEVAPNNAKVNPNSELPVYLHAAVWEHTVLAACTQRFVLGSLLAEQGFLY